MAAPFDMETFAAHSDALQAAALTTTRLAATSLPADLSFHRSIDRALAQDIDVFSNRVISLVSKLVRVASGKTGGMREEEDVVDEFVRNIVDPMEGMLESTDGSLDVFLGRRKEPTIPIPAIPVEPRGNNTKKQPFRGRLDPALTHASHLPKPQLLFKHTVNNADESPYIPAALILHKWCAKVPLGYVFHDERPNQGIEDRLGDDDEEESKKRTLHPYYYELTHPSYPDHVFNPLVDSSPLPPSKTPSLRIPTVSNSLTFVSTPEALLSMAKAIMSSTELAVDLEHHSYRSYNGFLALMQISTRQGDFVVDLLVPTVREGLRQAKNKSDGASEEERVANEAGKIIARVFADSSIIKVFHGAESDILWLQQDFNIFVVGLFDTFHASKLLGFPKHSLAYLLETYCDVIPDKRYQLADWRIRPLPTEMLNYARSDTRFLLYIYDNLRSSLAKRPPTAPGTPDESPDANQTRHGQGLIYSVLALSSRTALRLYETEVYDAESGTGSSGWDTLARKWNKFGLLGSPLYVRGTNTQAPQAAVYKALHRWREDVAREEDESTRYVLPAHHIFLLAEHVPTTIPDLLSLFGGPGGANGGVPPVLKRRIGEVLAVIKGAIETDGSSRGPQGPTEVVREGTGMVASATLKETEAMSSTMPSSSTTKLIKESRLWTVVPSAPTVAISISQSALFGDRGSGERAQEEDRPSLGARKESYSATRSVLFGSTLFEATAVSTLSPTKSTLARAQVPSDSSKRFEDIMKKIHNTLVVVPSARTQMLETPHSDALIDVGSGQSDSAVPEALDTTPLIPEGQIEIPFVPAHKRQTLSGPQINELKDDTIVVVGQPGARQRKRKRDKVKRSVPSLQSKFPTRLSDTETSPPAGNHDREAEEFDYASVPNLLDNESGHEDARGSHEEDQRRKKKQRHGKGMLITSSGRQTASTVQEFIPC